MKITSVGPFDGISRMVLGGGGIGQVWGETDVESAYETLDAALSAGINLLDMAPGYRKAQSILGNYFGGSWPSNVRVTSKEWIGQKKPEEYYSHLRVSVETSLKTLGISKLDLFFLHNEICPEGYRYPKQSGDPIGFSTPWQDYIASVVPAFEKLKSEGLIEHWGLTGTGHPDAIISALRHEAKPSVVQVNTNLLDSPGNLARFDGPAKPREILKAAKDNHVGTLGIRILQAGALTSSFDRSVDRSDPNYRDYVRAAPFRSLCADMNWDVAATALRYALSMDHVDAVVLGTKNLAELKQSLDAEKLPPLSANEIKNIDESVLKTSKER